ncbi:MAG: glycosyltransferase [Janthinobacterium lividum]
MIHTDPSAAATAANIFPAQSIGVVIPTYNAEPHWPELSASLALQGIPPDHILVIDSSSRDRTRLLAEQSGYRVLCIAQTDFNHGATRQMACDYFPTAEMLVFLTQDAIPHGTGSIERLCQALDDASVGAAYGRQAPRVEASPIERHARLFNYPEQTQVRTFESRHKLGIKAAFCSNSFAVYRCSALKAVGGFPKNVILAEDSMVAARLLMSGWKVTYQANAVAIHSHPIRLRQEFSRYFDTGAHHSREAWLQKVFGEAQTEGKLFLKSEMQYLRKHAPELIPLALFRTLNKLAAYRLGKLQQHLPLALNRRLSGYPHFWQSIAAQEKKRATTKSKELPEVHNVPTHVG